MRLLTLLPFGLAFGFLQVALQAGNDDDLVHRLKAREPRAMSDLYERYGRVAYSLICHIVKNAAIAEDLVLETFMRVWNRMDAFDGEHGALGVWILVAARNRAIDYLRSSGSYPGTGAPEFEKLERPQFFTSVDANMLSIDLMRRVKQALERLSPEQKHVIELVYYEGLSQADIANRLNQPVETVKTWICGAMKILRDEMEHAASA